MAISERGSGTKNDPYIVSTVRELYDTIRASWDNVGVRYIDVDTDLDFNNDPDFYECPSNFIQIDVYDGKTLIIDFKGHTLSNIFSANTEGSFLASGRDKHIMIKNAIIEAVLITTTGNTLFSQGSSDYSSYPLFVNCDFRIKYYIYSTYAYNCCIFTLTFLRNCVVNIDVFYTSNSYIFSDATGSSVVTFMPFRGLTGSGSSESFDGVNYRTISLYNEYNIRFIYIGTADKDSDTINIFPIGGNNIAFSSIFITSISTSAKPPKIRIQTSSDNGFNNCFFVCKNTSQTLKSNFYFSYQNNTSVSGVNFYDAEVGDTVDFSKITSGTMLALTTAQCKDAAFLESQGYIIAYDGS